MPVVTGFVYTTPKKFDNSVLPFHSENASNVFCPHYAGNLGQGNQISVVMSSFSQSCVCFLKCFQSTLERKVGVFKFLRFVERLRKAPFSWRISVDGRAWLNHLFFAKHHSVSFEQKLSSTLRRLCYDTLRTFFFLSHCSCPEWNFSSDQSLKYVFH